MGVERLETVRLAVAVRVLAQRVVPEHFSTTKGMTALASARKKERKGEPRPSWGEASRRSISLAGTKAANREHFGRSFLHWRQTDGVRSSCVQHTKVVTVRFAVRDGYGIGGVRL